MATLRGSKEALLDSIAKTLTLALNSANDEDELRANIRSVIKIVENQAKVKWKWRITEKS